MRRPHPTVQRPGAATLLASPRNQARRAGPFGGGQEARDATGPAGEPARDAGTDTALERAHDAGPGRNGRRPEPEAREAPVPPHGSLALAIVLAAGACAALALASGDAASAGARRLRSPEIVLAAFDAVTILVLVRPGRRGLLETATTLAVALPFHLAAAAAAGAGPGHHAASALVALSWGTSALVAARFARGAAALLVATATWALPLAAYALGDFARAGASASIAEPAGVGRGVAAALHASPLLCVVLLARRAVDAAAADAIPAVAAAGAVVAVSWGLHVARRRAGGA